MGYPAIKLTLTPPKRKRTKEPKVYYSPAKRCYIAKYPLRDPATDLIQWKTKPVPVNINDEVQALAWLKSWLQLKQLTGVEPHNEDVPKQVKTIRGLSGLWVETKKKDATHGRKRSDPQRMLDVYVLNQPIADIPMEKMQPKHAIPWINYIINDAIAPKTGRRLAPNSARNIIQSLREFFTDARGLGWVDMRENPLNDAYLKKQTKGAQTQAGNNTIIHLTLEQVKTLLASKLDDQTRALYTLAVTSGMRQGEIMALSWGDIERGKVKVFRQLEQGKQGSNQFTDPKKNSHRWLPLHPIAYLKLMAIKPETHQVDAPIFGTEDGEYQRPNLAKRLRRDLRAAGLPDKFDLKWPITFHALRRTFMTLLEDQGVTRDKIGWLAGHAASSVSDRHYIAKNISTFAPLVGRIPL